MPTSATDGPLPSPLTPDQIREARRLRDMDVAAYMANPHPNGRGVESLNAIMDRDAERRQAMAASNVAPRAQEMRNRQLGSLLANLQHVQAMNPDDLEIFAGVTLLRTLNARKPN